MDNPFSFRTDRPVRRLGQAFGTPLALQGWSWLPANELIFWALFTWRSMRARAGWPAWKHALLGGAKTVVVLGSEWCHNLAHVAAARAIGKPVDAMRIILGMPVLLYDEPEHPSITPRQHILRSAAGPACNLGLLVLGKGFQRLTPPGSPAREAAEAAVKMNAFIASAAFLPIPELDGGPILKWSLIAGGMSPAQAARIIGYAKLPVGLGLVGAALALLLRWRQREPYNTTNQH